MLDYTIKKYHFNELEACWARDTRSGARKGSANGASGGAGAEKPYCDRISALLGRRSSKDWRRERRGGHVHTSRSGDARSAWSLPISLPTPSRIQPVPIKLIDEIIYRMLCLHCHYWNKGGYVFDSLFEVFLANK